ncbi:MAG: DUF3160 domain-containing protein [Candidatus Brocadiia bacterium]
MNAARRAASLLLAFALFGTLAGIAVGEEPAAKIGTGFASFYKPVEYTVNPCVKGYSLPLAEGSVAACKALDIMGIAPNDPGLLARGFALSDKLLSMNIAYYYSSMTGSEVPVFLTADTVLHMQHVLFMKSLAALEENELSRSIVEVMCEIKVRAEMNLGDEPDSMRRRARELISSYCKVALALLDSYAETKDNAVKGELALIEHHAGSSPSPIFGYAEDYSQYVPRGHYTHSEKLKKYFRAMTWIGRMTFLAKGKMPGMEDALVDLKTAQVQSLAALMLPGYLASKRAKYDAIYSATSFFAGFSDDLTMDAYSGIARKLFGDKPPDLSSPEKYAEFLKEIALLLPPDIYGSTGGIAVGDLAALEGAPKPELLDKLLSVTTGFRLMGQRFAIDSYWHGRLCYPSVGKFSGTAEPFTNAPYRTMVSSLDVMALLGSAEAKAILKDQQLDAYEGYAEMAAKLSAQMGKLSADNWHSTMFMSTLDAARSLFARSGEGWQPFQRTDAWERRQLNAALGSWTALRHDTLLYIKHGGEGDAGPSNKPCVGYVEPEPDLFARMLALNRQLQAGLVRIAPTFEGLTGEIEAFSGFLDICLKISISELEGKQPTEAEQQWLKALGTTIWKIIGREPRDFSTILVADVFGDGITGQVLETATGQMRSMAVVWARPDGTLEVAVGPIYSWEEFKQPMGDRLTDEAWIEMVRKGSRTAPVWLQPFFAGK